MERYICVHGHFYQPPRSNPWLETIELQDSAHPYHDWNERITAECYGPNTAARILDHHGRILQIVNNYAKMSFNFGPTLLAWLEHQAPAVYAAVLTADRESQARFAGHGAALAQAYNHMILPLANRRDKYTQVLWGIADFTHRFGRHPEGMWLPETAVDLETLEVLAACGIRFTILAPTQACRVRARGAGVWHDVSDGSIDPTMPYVQRLPSGRQIVLFFYHAALARGVAFERLLTDGQQFAHRLLDAFNPQRPGPQLVHVATDGETYGHHHRFGEMALAYALHYIETHKLARLTNYGAFLEHHPPTHEVEIINNTSWSCAHGIERWRSNCGCRTGGPPTWQQTWRTPLRAALDWLRDALAPAYEQRGSQVLRDPWAARDDYISVVLERSPQRLAHFLQRHARHPLTTEETAVALKLLDMQRHAMLMYTSCGWFFDELSGLEPRQVLHHAARAIHLAGDLGVDPTLEQEFLERLAQARSNLPEYHDGRQIYERWVRPAMVSWEQLAVQYAMRLLFEPAPMPPRVYCYTVEIEDLQRLTGHQLRCVVGRARLTSAITHDTAVLDFGAWHRGAHHLYGGACMAQGTDGQQPLLQAVRAALARADCPAMVRLLHAHFGATTWSLGALRRDAQHQLLPCILEAMLPEIEAVYRQLYEPHRPLLHTLAGVRLPAPRALQAAADYLLSLAVQRAFTEETPDPTRLSDLLAEAEQLHITLDATLLQSPIAQTLARLMTGLVAQPDDLTGLARLVALLRLVRTLPFSIDLWQAQNLFSTVRSTIYAAFRHRAEQGEAEARTWLHHFRALGDLLSVRVD